MNDMRKSFEERAQSKVGTSQENSKGEGPELGDAAATDNEVTGQATSQADKENSKGEGPELATLLQLTTR